MSISGSLSNALSGLTAAARAADVVSSNVANALTPGYGRRELELSARSIAGVGAGVKVDGVSRDVDQLVLADRRLADAGAAEAEQYAAFNLKLEDAIGLPGDLNSLNGRIAALEAALTEAASRPDSDARLQATVDAADALAMKFNATSDAIQSLRKDADTGIAQQVDLLNDRLTKIADLNAQIRRHQGAGHETAALIDQRQALVDDIAEIVPLRVVGRDFGEIAIYTQSGATLLDGKASQIGFTQTGTIVPEMTYSGGALSGLTINGREVNTGAGYSPISGGRLAALFHQRDDLAQQAQTSLDALARDLTERFQSPLVDPTLALGDPGLFTDEGGAVLAANEIGLSARLSLNALVDPGQPGGAAWRMRDGLGATAVGLSGDATVLNALAQTLSQARIPASGQFGGAARSASGLASEFLSVVSAARQGAEADHSFARAKADTLLGAQLADGVDTDAELQRLLLIEKAYAANAKVIQTVDDLLDNMLRL